MEINILECIDGAKQAKGLTVIIDVFRAFSLECYLFQQGAERIIPIGDLDQAFALKAKHPDWYLFGERKGAKVDGCDFGNSPCEVANIDFSHKTIIHTTSAGTQGIVNAKGADEIVTASIVNAKAVTKYIRQKNPDCVSIVAMGNQGVSRADEDLLCAKYIKALLEKKEFPIEQEVEALKNGAGAKFFDPANLIFPEEDFALCTDVNRFDFVIQVTKNGNVVEKNR
ncbi:2-phosphosulfolactate phosphatase [Absicoccus porci]|uniref:2-phosphosulfolactate phosphatase n=1 Tax=Absicoccus porci TaxID=2486576 RepID=UPI0029428548|nr:2-phosphosulfolactate phosphatase [Absicoccus porci]